MDPLIQNILTAEGLSAEQYYIAVLDGSSCPTTKDFLKQIAIIFKFPSYFGQNLNALNDCLSDLEWLDKPNYLLIIDNSKEFLKNEPGGIRDHIFNFLERIAREWAAVPNYEGEDSFRKKADFRIKII